MPTATLTPTITGTVPVAPTPTSAATPTPPVLLSASYYYDGDGNLVKSVVNNVTTYYIGRVYEKQVEGASTTERKYYFAGNTTLAMRVDEVLYWLVADHLGSTSITANAEGSMISEVRYTAFGEIRYSLNSMPTDYLYTGQRREEEIGLYYYVARWYDPYVNHWTQPDTIVPNPYGIIDWNRFAYVGYNPICYADPMGHMRTQEDSYHENASYWSSYDHDMAIQAGILGEQELIYGHEYIPPEVQNQVIDLLNGTIVGMVFEPVDYYYTFQDISDNGFHWYHSFAFLPILTFGVAKGIGQFAEDALPAISKRSDDIIDALPEQAYHFLTNIHSKYSPLFEEIVKKYGLDLNEAWNIRNLPHVGRHPHAYQDWVYASLKEINDALGGGIEKSKDFINAVNSSIINKVLNNPLMLRKQYWINK